MFYLPWVCNIQFSGIAPLLGGRLQKCATFNQVVQAENRPAVVTSLVRPLNKPITADGRLPLVAEFAIRKAPEAQNFIDNQSSGNFTMVYRNHARIAS